MGHEVVCGLLLVQLSRGVTVLQAPLSSECVHLLVFISPSDLSGLELGEVVVEK